MITTTTSHHIPERVAAHARELVSAARAEWRMSHGAHAARHAARTDADWWPREVVRAIRATGREGWWAVPEECGVEWWAIQGSGAGTYVETLDGCMIVVGEVVTDDRLLQGVPVTCGPCRWTLPLRTAERLLERDTEPGETDDLWTLDTIEGERALWGAHEDRLPDALGSYVRSRRERRQYIRTEDGLYQLPAHPAPPVPCRGPVIRWLGAYGRGESLMAMARHELDGDASAELVGDTDTMPRLPAYCRRARVGLAALDASIVAAWHRDAWTETSRGRLTAWNSPPVPREIAVRARGDDYAECVVDRCATRWDAVVFVGDDLPPAAPILAGYLGLPLVHLDGGRPITEAIIIATT